MFGGQYTGFWWGNLRERALLEDPVIDGRIILRWNFRKWDVGAWTESMWLGIGTVFTLVIIIMVQYGHKKVHLARVKQSSWNV